MLTSASDVKEAIDTLTELRARVAAFEKDGTIAPGVAEIVRTEISRVIQILIPF